MLPVGTSRGTMRGANPSGPNQLPGPPLDLTIGAAGGRGVRCASGGLGGGRAGGDDGRRRLGWHASVVGVADALGAMACFVVDKPTTSSWHRIAGRSFLALHSLFRIQKKARVGCVATINVFISLHSPPVLSSPSRSAARPRAVDPSPSTGSARPLPRAAPFSSHGQRTWPSHGHHRRRPWTAPSPPQAHTRLALLSQLQRMESQSQSTREEHGTQHNVADRSETTPSHPRQAAHPPSSPNTHGPPRRADGPLYASATVAPGGDSQHSVPAHKKKNEAVRQPEPSPPAGQEDRHKIKTSDKGMCVL